MSDQEAVHLLFHVPEGLEFVAAKDIKNTLTSYKIINDDPTLNLISYEPKTGHVHLFCQTENIATLKSQLSATPFYSIYSITLIASESLIPPEIFDADDPQPTYDFIARQTKLTTWYKVLPEQPKRQGDEKQQDSTVPLIAEKDTISFRATFKKGSLKHKARSQEIAGYVGFVFSSFFKHWKVKMTGYDYEIMGLWLRTDNKYIVNRAQEQKSAEEHQQNKGEEKPVVLLLGVTIPVHHDQKQRNRVFVGRTSLNPCIAYCLALVADPQPGQVILDMCCGTGTIPIEGASKFKNTLWLGSEVNYKTLTQKASGNLKHSDLKNVELLLADGRKLCYRDNSIDIIVSDWPWGLRENSFTQIQGLYPKFLKQLWRILKVDGKAYIVTQGCKLMNRTLAYDWCKLLWTVEEIIPIGIGGYDVYLYKLARKST